MGYCTFLEGNLITWKSEKQSVVVRHYVKWLWLVVFLNSKWHVILNRARRPIVFNSTLNNMPFFSQTKTIACNRHLNFVFFFFSNSTHNQLKNQKTNSFTNWFNKSNPNLTSHPQIYPHCSSAALDKTWVSSTTSPIALNIIPQRRNAHAIINLHGSYSHAWQSSWRIWLYTDVSNHMTQCFPMCFWIGARIDCSNTRLNH
jgi:hypothetical protein